MTPVKMETTSDCFRACLASMLNVPLDEVLPLDRHVPAGNLLSADALTLLQDWMLERGLYPIFLPIIAEHMPNALNQLNYRFPDIHVMLSGMTRKGVIHAVLVKEGTVVHDPAPVGQGDLEPFPISGGHVFQAFLIGKAV